MRASLLTIFLTCNLTATQVTAHATSTVLGLLTCKKARDLGHPTDKTLPSALSNKAGGGGGGVEKKFLLFPPFGEGKRQAKKK